MTTYVWRVDLFNLDLLEDEKARDLIADVVDSIGTLFSTEARALAYAVTLREEHEQLVIGDGSGDPDEPAVEPLTWTGRHAAPNFEWSSGNVAVVVRRVELDIF